MFMSQQNHGVVCNVDSGKGGISTETANRHGINVKLTQSELPDIFSERLRLVPIFYGQRQISTEVLSC